MPKDQEEQGAEQQESHQNECVPEQKPQDAVNSENSAENDGEADPDSAESELQKESGEGSQEVPAKVPDEESGIDQQNKSLNSVQTPGPAKQIFVVLSQREDINQDCIAVLLKLGVRYFILNEPDEVRSLEEILNTNPQIRFALIILAGDDFVYDRLSGKPGEALLGAKQNVVFHLGYLLAKFGNPGTLTVFKEQKAFHLPVGYQHTAFVAHQKGGAWEEILKSKLKQKNIL